MATSRSPLPSDHFHVLVFCALSSELQAAREVLENGTNSTFSAAHVDLLSGLSVCRQWNNTPLTVALVAQADVGGKACIARLTELKANNFSVDLAAMTGICAGVENIQGGREYGTVVVGGRTAMEEGGKRLPNGKFLPQANPEKLDKNLSLAIADAIARLEATTKWLESIPQAARRPSPRYAQELVLNELAKAKESGKGFVNKRDLIASLKSHKDAREISAKIWDGILEMCETCRWASVDSGVVKLTENGNEHINGLFEFPRPDEITVVMDSIGTIPSVTLNLPNEKEQYNQQLADRKLAAFEMEADPFMSHSKSEFPHCLSLVMKGISDYGTPMTKKDYYQKYAASTPAAFLRYLLEPQVIYDRLAALFSWPSSSDTDGPEPVVAPVPVHHNLDESAGGASGRNYGYPSRDLFRTPSNDFITINQQICLPLRIFPNNSSMKFTAVCDIPSRVGQAHNSVRLTGNPPVIIIPPEGTSVDREGTTLTQRDVELLLVKVDQLVMEVSQQKQRANVAEKRADVAEKRADVAERQVYEGKETTDAAIADYRGELLVNLALRCDKLRCGAHDQGDFAPPTWTMWDAKIPSCSCPPFGSVAMANGRLVVGGSNEYLHVLTTNGKKWRTFVRENGVICCVVCHQGRCVVLVKDTTKHQYVVEEFCISRDNKWNSLTVLPSELQLPMLDVSVALNDSSLYAVGGRTAVYGGESVGTAHVFDLGSGQWSKLDDMPTRRYSSSCAIINNTVYVTGVTGEFQLSTSVEALCPDSKQWKTITCSSSSEFTLVAASNQLVATGGKTQKRKSSDVVELFDQRTFKWLPLPSMTCKRWRHGAFSSENGELVTVGGCGKNSIESLTYI